MLENYKMRNKLIVLLFLPLLGVFGFASQETWKKAEILKETQTIQSLIELKIETSGLIHELQKERGLSAGYLGSGGLKFSQEVAAQRALSDQILTRWQQFALSFEKSLVAPELKDSFALLQSLFQKMGEHRTKIDSLQVDAAGNFGYYSKLIQGLLSLVAQIPSLSHHQEISRLATAQLHWIEAKERAGQERATLNNVFAKDRFEGDLFARWIALRTVQQTQINFFLEFASEEQIQRYQAAFQGSVVEEVERYRQLAESKMTAQALGTDPAAWFKASTLRIELMKTLEDEWANALTQRVKAVQQQAKQALVIFLSGTLLSLGLTLWLSLKIVRSITRPLFQLKQATQQIAKGDLKFEWQVQKRTDEIGELFGALIEMVHSLQAKVNLAEAIAKGDLTQQSHLASERDQLGLALQGMLKNLNEILGHVTQTTQIVALQATQVAQASENLADGASKQAAALEEMNASMTEITAQSRQNSANAAVAHQLGVETRQSATRGDQHMRSMIQSLAEMDNSSRNISKIIKVIDEIAFQTNLLALNAAVEAARAGKYGKGFAVVAEEVRNLAGRSAQAAHETTEMIQDSVQKVKHGIEIGHQTAQALTEIVQSVAKAGDVVAEISSASKDQLNSMTEINQGMIQSEQVTQQNSAISEECAANAEEMSQHAETLSQMLRRFQLHTGRPQLPSY